MRPRPGQADFADGKKPCGAAAAWNDQLKGLHALFVAFDLDLQ